MMTSFTLRAGDKIIIADNFCISNLYLILIALWCWAGWEVTSACYQDSWKQQLAADWLKCQHQHKNCCSGEEGKSGGCSSSTWTGLTHAGIIFSVCNSRATAGIKFGLRILPLTPFHNVHLVCESQSEPKLWALTALYQHRAGFIWVLKH